MKKRCSVEQIVVVLKQVELGLPVVHLIRKVGISEQTFYRWKKQYAGLELDGLVIRVVTPGVPPRVDYTLTALGLSLREPIEALGH